MSLIDWLSLNAIKAGAITVDVEAGTITTTSTGNRAELLDKRTAYGRVWVSRQHQALAMAHRVVWIAAHGLPPVGLQINHLNRLRWDNRIANLELVTPGGNVRHSIGRVHDAIGPRGNVDTAWLQRLDEGERSQEPDFDPYHRMRHGRAFLVS